MRPIENQEKKLQKIKRNQLIMGIILIGLMIFSSIGYAFSNNFSESSSANKKKIDGISFEYQGDRWYFTVNGLDYITKFNPEDTRDVIIENQLSLSDFTGKPLYFVGDRGEQFSEIELNLGNRIVQRIQFGCIEGENCTGDIPIKDCSSDNVLIYKESKEGFEKIYQKNNCVYIESTIPNQALYADTFLFDILELSK